MRNILNACAVTACIICSSQSLYAQTGGVAVGFKNDLNTTVIVQGFTIDANKLQKRGQPIVIPPGKTLGENNVPAGIRYYTVHDARNPSVTYILNAAVPVGSRDMGFAVTGIPPKGVLLKPLP